VREGSNYSVLAAIGFALILAACGGGGDDSESEAGDAAASGDNGGGTDVPVAQGEYALLAWNDLGMHCIDSDYSVFSLLPPFNVLNAQLVHRGGGVVESGVELTYEAVADPSGSVNSTSRGKTNFWDYAEQLYGPRLEPDTGLKGFSMPSRGPAAMHFDRSHRWFAAEGIPITPVDDEGRKNEYPMMRVKAIDPSGRTLATADVVLPVSDEMTCVRCHGSAQGVDDARPRGGWVQDADPERDWRLNILRLHDERSGDSHRFRDALARLGLDPQGLEASARSGHPVLCAGCHRSNALPGTGLDGIAQLTTVIHDRHASVTDPETGLSLDDDRTRAACYRCHPGSSTQCLRGAMGKATDPAGNPLVQCQSCHGRMSAVGRPGREGWLDLPNCQACHHDGQRGAKAVRADGSLIRVSDRRFATNADTPAPGYGLYRFSRGHGDLYCESCHGATHAIYPSAEFNDNVLARELQGYAGTIRECAVCHDPVPYTATGGPHGMHTIGAAWVRGHGDSVEHSGPEQCTACHGADYRGSPLSAIKTAKEFRHEHGIVRYRPGDPVTCYDCHNGPHED